MIREMFCFQMRAHTDTRADPRPVHEMRPCFCYAAARFVQVKYQEKKQHTSSLQFFSSSGLEAYLIFAFVTNSKKTLLWKNPHSLYHRNMPHLTSWDRIKHGHMARPVRDAWAQMGSCIFIHYSNECQQPITLRTNTQQPHTHRLPPDSRYIKCCGTSFHPCYENT